MATTQRWTLEVDGHEHVVEVDDAGLRRQVVWRRDGEQLARTRTGDERVQLVPAGEARAGSGAVSLRFGTFGPARRVTWHAGEHPDALAAAVVGLGGLDLVPEPGSRAARREEWVRDHPRLFTAQRTAAAVLGVVGGLLVTWLLARVAVSVPLPDGDLPRLPLPDLPDVPWPDVPWPEVSLPDWALPGWLRTLADGARLVVPVVVAVALARGELRRRGRQDERRARAEPPAAPPPPG